MGSHDIHSLKNRRSMLHGHGESKGKLVIKTVVLEPGSHGRILPGWVSIMRSVEATDVKGMAFLSYSSPSTSQRNQKVLEALDLKNSMMWQTCQLAPSHRKRLHPLPHLAWGQSRVNLGSPHSAWPTGPPHVSQQQAFHASPFSDGHQTTRMCSVLLPYETKGPLKIEYSWMSYKGIHFTLPWWMTHLKDPRSELFGQQGIHRHSEISVWIFLNRTELLLEDYWIQRNGEKQTYENLIVPKQKGKRWK